VADVARLLQQLSPGRTPPDLDELAQLLAQPGATLLIARDQELAVGMLTLIVYRLPGGVRGRIEAVVVDEAARGRGVGEALTREALRLAASQGATAVDLTSRAAREAANRLYRRLGFEQRETNVFTWRPA
jgi:ribosomal protein S18 acetylase RimI-like enzyme